MSDKILPLVLILLNRWSQGLPRITANHKEPSVRSPRLGAILSCGSRSLDASRKSALVEVTGNTY